MHTLEFVLSESQYEQLKRKAKERHTSVGDLVLEAVETFLRTEEDSESLYVRLAHKQALWRKRITLEGNRRLQLGKPSSSSIHEQPVSYTTELGQSVEDHLANLRLDLIYHSEALEGSPLTREQVEEAITELSSQ
jgi:hypothetical protein